MAAAPQRAAAVSHVGDTTSVACPNGTISEVFVKNHSVFPDVEKDPERRFLWAYRAANSLHVRTRESVIRREILFEAGDCYDPAVLEDSERVLRATPFIAEADVFGARQADGSYHVVVETRDEWSTRLEPQVESRGGFRFRGIELREDNLFGRGQRVSAFYKESQEEQVYGASVGTRQLLGTHLDAEFSAGKTPVGHALTQRLAYPFRGETGRWAARQQIETEDRYFEFLRRQDGRLVRVLFPEQRRSFDVGGVFRLGRRGNLTLFGLAMAGEWIAYPDGTKVVDNDGRLVGGELADSVVQGLDSVSSVRAVFLVGQRNVRFDRRRALDAVRGAEDVRLGVEVEVAVGRSLEAFSSDDDLALDFGLFTAGDLPGNILSGVRVLLEGKRDFEAEADVEEWKDVFGQLDAWAYWRPSSDSRHTVVGAVAASGGWHTAVPFQLTLGGRSGLRGYPRHVHTGERRAVVTLEHRAYLGWPYPQLLDLGSAVFVDVGRSWAGGDQFAVASPYEASVGFGLRGAFPAGSRRTYRIDVAAPVSGGLRAGDAVVSIGMGQAVGRRAVSDDRQLRRSSRRALTASLFSFPN